MDIEEVSKLTRYVIIAAVIAVAGFIIWFFGSIVAYILISALVAIIGKPLVSMFTNIKIRKWKMPRSMAAMMTLIVIWGVFITAISLVVPLVLSKLREFSLLDMSMITSSFQEPLKDLQFFIEKVFFVTEDQFSLKDIVVQEVFNLFDIDLIRQTSSSIVATATDIGIGVFSVTFISFFFLKEEHLFSNMVVMLFPKRYEKNIEHALNSVNVLLMRYFTGIFFESVILSLISSCALMLFGVQTGTAFFMGITLGVLNVIPYIGPLIALAIGLVVGLLSPIDGVSTQGMIFIIIGCLVGSNLIDNIVLQPVIYSNRAKAHPLEIFLVLLIAGNLAGVLGMLLAVPAYTVLRVFAKEFLNKFSLVKKLTENI